MKSAIKSFQIKFRNFFKKGSSTEQNFIKKHSLDFHSVKLKRVVRYDLYFPAVRTKGLSCLIFNDGQDLGAMNTTATLNRMFGSGQIDNFLLIGIHAGDRMQEYGTVSQPDYAGRGSKAKAYTQFILEEFLPYLQKRYRINKAGHSIAGCSLGGLSALDIAWSHPEIFSNVGVFSGSLWWRSTPFDEKTPDANRIMHIQVAKAGKREGLKFWFQAGTKDEEGDRNQNGIIDAIDDTLQLIDLLRKSGYSKHDIRYVEVEGGEHNVYTWGEILPDFLKWSFGNTATSR